MSTDLERLQRTAALSPCDSRVQHRLCREMHRRGLEGGISPLSKRYTFAWDHQGGWVLPQNPIWNVPLGTNRVPFQIEHWPGFHRALKKVRGLAMDARGCVYGVRTLSGAREQGYCLEGKVSIGGRFFRAFTSSRIFQREDGSMVDVGILYVCRPD